MKETGNRRTLLLLSIILLGLGIRVTGLKWGQGYSSFSSRDSLEAYTFVVDYARGDAKAQYLGQPNYNLHAKVPGPLWSLFGFIGVRYWGTVEGMVLMILLVNIILIYTTYLLAERTVGASCALWAALFTATLPIPVYYSVFVYNPNVMPFFGSLLFLALWEVTQRDRSRCIFWVMLILLIMPQFHLSVFSLLPAGVIILLISSARLNLPWLFAGLFCGATLYVPYVRGEIAHGWENTLAIPSGRPEHLWGGLKAAIAPWNMLVNYVPRWSPSAREYRELGQACFGWSGIFVALNLLSGIIALLLLSRVFQETRKAMSGFFRSPRQAFKRSPAVIFLAIVIVVPLLCVFFSRQTYRIHYSIIWLAPLLSLVSYALMKWLASPRVGKVFLVAVILMTCGNIWFMPAMFHYQGVCIDHGEYFLGSFHNLETVYQKLKAHAGNRCIAVDNTNYKLAITDPAYLPTLTIPAKRRATEGRYLAEYVDTREKEFTALHGIKTAPITYVLYRADQVPEGVSGIAYQGKGIALVARDPSP